MLLLSLGFFLRSNAVLLYTSVVMKFRLYQHGYILWDKLAACKVGHAVPAILFIILAYPLSWQKLFSCPELVARLSKDTIYLDYLEHSLNKWPGFSGTWPG